MGKSAEHEPFDFTDEEFAAFLRGDPKEESLLPSDLIYDYLFSPEQKLYASLLTGYFKKQEQLLSMLGHDNPLIPILHEIQLDKREPAVKISLSARYTPPYHRDPYTFSPKYATFTDYRAPHTDAIGALLGRGRIQKLEIGAHTDPLTLDISSQKDEDYWRAVGGRTTYYPLDDPDPSQRRILKFCTLPQDFPDQRPDVFPQDSTEHVVLSPFMEADAGLMQLTLRYFEDQLD